MTWLNLRHDNSTDSDVHLIFFSWVFDFISFWLLGFLFKSEGGESFLIEIKIGYTDAKNYVVNVLSDYICLSDH